MDPEEKKQVQSIIDQLKWLFLPDGGEIVGSINSSSSEFAMNIIAHIVRENESGSNASERKTTRETPDRDWIIDKRLLRRQYLFDISLLHAVGYWCAVVVCKLSVFPVYLYISLAIYLLDSKVPPPPEAQYPYPNQYPYPYPYQYPDPPENLQQYFGHKRKDVAEFLGVSVSTFKRKCRKQGILQWQNRRGISGSVLRPPDQYEERNTSTACEAPPHNVQTGIEGESVGHSLACFTVQTLSPRPSARRTPAPTAEPSIPLEDRQQEENEASFMDTTSISYSDLSRLCEGMNIVQTDDILGGQGSAALWDYTIDSGMGEQNREVETREQPSPQRSPAADRGKGPANNEMEMPIRLFPLANQVEEVYHPLLNAIARAHPETFAHFNPQTPLLGPMLLRNLHDLLVPWARLRFDEFTLAKETAMQKLSQDLVRLGFDLGWLIARGSALRAAKERVALQPEIQSLSTLVESTRESLANLEARLAQAKRQDAELAAATLNLADLGPSELVFEELAS